MISLRAILALCLLMTVAACGHSTPDPEQPVVPATGDVELSSVDDWCAVHALPESKCTKCNPHLAEAFQASGDWCAGHGFPESVCPSCNPVDPPSEIERASGIEVERARSGAVKSDIDCTARIEFDRNRLADIRASIPGVVREVNVDLGEPVSEGTQLFVLESAEVGDLQGKLRAADERVEVARANHDRQRDLGDQKIASAREVELAREELGRAEADLDAIEAGLRIAGATASDFDGRFRVRSPIAGTVVRRPATIGTFATSEVSLATVVDTTLMWAVLEVREADAGALRDGQTVTMRIDGLPGREFAGTVTWIASEVDPKTRTVAARAEVANPAGLLRAEQFARASIRVGESEGTLVIPVESVQRVGDEPVVFVRTGVGLYEPRIVILGRSDAELVEIRGTLGAGDPIVTEGAFLLRTELSRESIGAGCCEVLRPDGS
jgi:cobalt-zinc-cadmium efflux system membrane fusion protein